jgi:hypothetical protein
MQGLANEIIPNKGKDHFEFVGEDLWDKRYLRNDVKRKGKADLLIHHRGFKVRAFRYKIRQRKREQFSLTKINTVYGDRHFHRQESPSYPPVLK